MARDFLIIDGSNFYHFAKSLLAGTGLFGFHYRKFVRLLGCSDGTLIEYCIGEVQYEKGSERSLEMFSFQQKLFAKLASQKVTVKTGIMLKSGKIYHEKGVDVRIAIDIVKGALRNEFDRCFLVSSDSDLLPAVLEVKLAGKQIIYVQIGKCGSIALATNCSRRMVVSRELLQKCL